MQRPPTILCAHSMFSSKSISMCSLGSMIIRYLSVKCTIQRRNSGHRSQRSKFLGLNLRPSPSANLASSYSEANKLMGSAPQKSKSTTFKRMNFGRSHLRCRRKDRASVLHAFSRGFTFVEAMQAKQITRTKAA